MDKPSVSNAFIIKQERIKTGITQSNYRLKKKRKIEPHKYRWKEMIKRTIGELQNRNTARSANTLYLGKRFT